jgi:hypothetical protein
MYVYLNVILKKVPKWGSKFFFTFPTSEGSDLLSSHVMQTPTFVSKLSDRNAIFRLDVGKILFPHLLENIPLFLTQTSIQIHTYVSFPISSRKTIWYTHCL